MALFFRFERDVLAVRHRLTLTLAKLTQHLKVNTVIAEFLFHIVVDFNSNSRLLPQRLTRPSAREAHGGDVDGRVSGEQGINLSLHIVVRRNDVEEILDDAKIEIDAEGKISGRKIRGRNRILC